MDFPRELQIEVTNACNLNCLMCIRNEWDANVGHMSEELFEKILEEGKDRVERFALYGEGEPLTHPKFIDFLKMIREMYGRESEIMFVTNGTLLEPSIAEKIFMDIEVDEVYFSIDTTDFVKLSRIRRGISPQKFFENLKHVAKLRERGNFKLGLSTVLMANNYRDLPDLVKFASQLNVDEVVVSHVVPYSKIVEEHYAAYTTLSFESFKVAKKLTEFGEDLPLKATYEAFFAIYGERPQFKAYALLKDVWSRATEVGVEVNTLGLFDTYRNIGFLEDVRNYIIEAKRVGEETGVNVDAPDVFPKHAERECPYYQYKTMFIRADGSVAPCMFHAYEHKTFINNHAKKWREITYGNVKNESIEEIWNKKDYVNLRKALERKNILIPWCGDCPYAKIPCWYLENDMDCLGNVTACSECPYMMGLAKCVL